MRFSATLLRLGGHRWLRRRSGLWIAAAALLGLLLGIAAIAELLEAAARPSARRVELYGHELPSGAAAEAALNAVRQRVSGWFNLKLPDQRELPMSYGALGVEIDRGRLRQLAEAAADPESALVRRHQRVAPGKAVELRVPLRINLELVVPVLLALKDDLDRPPSDARLDPDGQGIIAERAGRLLDIDRSLFAIQTAIERGDQAAALVFEEQAPARRAAELSRVNQEVVLGSFETPYDLAARAKDRTFNLQLAASRLDGYVLMPGEQFDFNRVVGPRDEANGYRVAKVIAEGELVDGIGGGTCQISGTLHAAALLAGLDIVERHPHTRPSSYIKLGFDAAVVYPTINLRLGNPYDFPVVLRQRVEGGRVRAEIRGAARPRTTTIVRRIEAARPFDEVQRDDERLARGVRVLGQRGVPAFDVRRYRILRDGPHAVREAVIDHYPATSQVVRIGSGSDSSAAGRPSNDAQPEYLADELLVLSQSSDPDAAPTEQRTPGRYGVPGWTREIGAPVWVAR